MGQTQSQQTPQLHSSRFQNYGSQGACLSSSQSSKRHDHKKPIRLQHEGILKIRSTPFPNCIQLSNDGTIFFLQNAQTTLQELLQGRLYTNRLFPIEDIQRLIENVLYTLAYLSEFGMIYEDLCGQNIYYTNGQFKLLPNQLIQENFYKKAYGNYYGDCLGQENMGFLSPELIIALRMKQVNIQDKQILNKSIVFIFGLILLEATTLMPSIECFDNNYDILNNIVTERLCLVEEHYNECIGRIIGNMLDYDFHERMDLKQLSIWVNREFMQYKIQQCNYKNDGVVEERVICKQKSNVSVKKSRLVYNENVEEQDGMGVGPSRSYSRTNMVYINGYQDGNYVDDTFYPDVKNGSKNSVYLGNVQHYDDEAKQKSRQKQKQKQIQNKNNVEMKTRNNRNYLGENPYEDRKNENCYRYERQEGYRNYADQVKKNKSYIKNSDGSSCYPPVESRLRDIGNLRHHAYLEQTSFKKNYDHQLEPEPTRKPLKQNKYYPSLNDIENMNQYSQTKRIVKHSEVSKVQGKQIQRQERQERQERNDRNERQERLMDRERERQRHGERQRDTFDSKQSRQSDSKCSVNDGSINRIKMEIQKSRKLIQEFRKCEDI